MVDRVDMGTFWQSWAHENPYIKGLGTCKLSFGHIIELKRHNFTKKLVVTRTKKKLWTGLSAFWEVKKGMKNLWA